MLIRGNSVTQVLKIRPVRAKNFRKSIVWTEVDPLVLSRREEFEGTSRVEAPTASGASLVSVSQPVQNPNEAGALSGRHGRAGAMTHAGESGPPRSYIRPPSHMSGGRAWRRRSR
ncbi:unnamed protein product, partial [Iphiclides podalirius]